MKTIVKKKVTLETKRHDFDNEFAYIEQWRNSILTDCYFVEKQFLWPDGSVKQGGIKYFYSPLHGDEVDKKIKPLNYNKFKWFDRLYFINQQGEIERIISGEQSPVDIED